MGAIRMNITLPEKTAKNLRKRVKPRERSAVIAEALELYFKRQSQTEIVRKMIEDYKEANEMTPEDQEWLDADLGEFKHED